LSERVLSSNDSREAFNLRLNEITINQRNLVKAGAPTIWANISAGNGIFRRGDRRLNTA